MAAYKWQKQYIHDEYWFYIIVNFHLGGIFSHVDSI